MAIGMFRQIAAPYRVRTWLILLVVAAALPPVIFSGTLFFRQLSIERADSERRILDRTKQLAEGVDQELARIIALTEILAVSGRLENNDIRGFHAQAVNVSNMMKTNVILRDMSGQQIVNARFNWGEALPKDPIFEVDRQAIATGKAQVSNLLTSGPAQSTPVAIVVAPYLRDGVPLYLVSLTIPLERLLAIVSKERLDPGWLAAIVDGNGLLVARSVDHETGLGTPVSRAVWPAIQLQPEGVLRFNSQLGIVLFMGYAHSKSSGWIVASGPPDELLAAGWRQNTLLLTGGFGVLLLIGIGLAMLLGRLFTRDIRQIVSHAESLGTGVKLPSLELREIEIDTLAREIKKASELIEQRTAALAQAQKMEAIGQLAGGIAHDINNMLGAIVANLDLLESALQSDPENKELADAALGAALRGADLIDRLLAFSRKQTLELKLVDLGPMLEQAMPLLTRTLGDRIAKELKIEPGIWPVFTDPAQLESCVLNLAINARDAMPDGGTLKIECRNLTVDEHLAKAYPDLAHGDYVVVSVTDTGTGIAPENIERVFEPFFTTKGVGLGSGLGLSMVYGTMRQSGGTVKIYSEVGQGTTISLYLPRPPASAEALARGKKEEPGTTILTGTERILVAEDNAEMRHVAIATLASLGYTPVGAESGDAALALLENGERFDLVFSDIMMPGTLTGIDLARIARERGLARKFVFASGFASPTAMQEQIRSGGDIVLRKPYRKAALAATIRKVLDQAEIEEAALPAR